MQVGLTTNGTKEKKGLSLREKSKQPQLTPRQLLVYIVVQIVSTVQGIMPVIYGEEINWMWFLISYIMNNIAYFMIMLLRGTKYDVKPDASFGNIVMNFFKDVLRIVRDPNNSDQEKIRELEKLLIWIVRELDALYQKQLDEFSRTVRENIEDIHIRFLDEDEPLLGTPGPKDPEKLFELAVETLNKVIPMLDPSRLDELKKKVSEKLE